MRFTTGEDFHLALKQITYAIIIDGSRQLCNPFFHCLRDV